MNNYPYYYFSDSVFIKGDVPMTKEEVRAITILKLRLKEDHVVIDVGAGTGSVSVQIASIVKYGFVHAVEKNDAAIDLIRKNCEKFEIKNLNIIKGEAPEAIEELTGFDRVFIGGSGGHLEEILKWADENLKSKGRIVVNAITLDTLNTTEKFFKEKKYNDVDIVQVSISKFKEMGNSKMLKANYPVFVISGEKSE
jgi:cobalt-precorrin-6B (C15)-methyltransferase